MKKLCLFLILTTAFTFAQEVEPIDVSNWETKAGDISGRDHSTMEDPRQALINQDIYNNARKNPIWCPTDSIWQEKRQELGWESFAEAACPTEGICDGPEVRDATATNGITINIYVHLLRNSNGSGGVNINNARAAYNQMLADYTAKGISFNLVGAQWINNSTYATIPAYSPFNNNWLNAINNMKEDYALYPRYICNIFVSGQASSPFGVLLGIATFPWDPDAITKRGGLWLNNISMIPGGHTMSHELGHCFGLWHTHHGVSEVQSCSACYEYASGVEGNIRGDFCADTPPTPTNYNCGPPGGQDCQGHAWGATQPENYMGYGPDSCINLFTTQQTKRMYCWIPDALPLWIAP